MLIQNNTNIDFVVCAGFKEDEAPQEVLELKSNSFIETDYEKISINNGDKND